MEPQRKAAAPAHCVIPALPISPKAAASFSNSAQGRTASGAIALFIDFSGGTAGALPYDDHLAIDSSGNIFGTTVAGGDVNPSSVCPEAAPLIAGCGAVFELTP